MNYNNPLPQSITNIIRFATALMFGLFSFIYLFFIQNDVLSEAQYVFSDGITSYSRFWGALIITVVLLIVQFLVAKVSKLNGSWHAVTFFPSFLLLAFVTSLKKGVIEDFTLGSWIWAFPLLIGLYVLLIYIKHKWRGESIDNGDYSVSRYLWPNFLVLFLMMVWCGANAPARDVYMYELKVERLLLSQDYETAARVGERSLETSPRLNELRMYALAQQGLLGEKLFDYPQPYGSRSLLMMDDTITRLHRFTSKDIQQALGAWANSSVKNLDDYLALLKKNPATYRNPLLSDYVLCNKLLQRDLRGFYREIHHYRDLTLPTSVLTLPRAYREAMLLQARSISRDSLLSFADTTMLTAYKEYRNVQQMDTSEVVRANLLRRHFGNTLWWYLDN